jgi:hypothetical protein
MVAFHTAPCEQLGAGLAAIEVLTPHGPARQRSNDPNTQDDDE